MPPLSAPREAPPAASGDDLSARRENACAPDCGCPSSAPASRRERVGWRSLEELSGDATAREFREREFPVGASELPEGIDRRALVQMLGASLSLAGLAACRRPVETIVPFVTPPDEFLPGIPKRYATTMPFGATGYGLLVESHEGRPTKIEGNELHPATRGSASAQMQAAILGLYDPDRSQHVLRRAAPGGELERVAWSDWVAAWQSLEPGLLASGGAGLAILAPPSSSPTLARLAGAVRERFPQLRWATWEPVSDENARAGIARLAGRPLQLDYDLGAARVVVSLDADLFLGESGAVAHARGFAAGRRLAAESDAMNRLWVVESALTTTGSMADHRLPLASGSVGGFALALAAALAVVGIDVGLPPGTSSALPAGVPALWLAALVRDLDEHRGASLVVAGRDQPPAVHTLALAINVALGNLGTTVFAREAVDVLAASGVELAELVAAMRAGAVSTLLVLGGNPAYDAPGDLELAGALAGVANVVHLGLAADETAELAHWHLPESHFLEAWGDCRAADGTASVVQPLIEPLFGGHSAIELLGLLATGAERSGYDSVQETWRSLLATTAEAAGFDAAFNRVLHDGLFAGSATEPFVMATPLVLPPTLAAELAAPATGATPGGLELVFRPSPAAHDGRFANVGWLQELPDAVTKLTWGGAAQLSPATAVRLGLASEDGARLRLPDDPRGVAIELPVWIVPGQADETVVVSLGYGRRAAGRIGNGIGVDVYPLRRSDRLGFVAGASLEPTGSRHRLAQTQDHGSMEGRPIVREASLDEWRQEPRFAEARVEVPKSAPLWKQHEYATGPQWAMTIDLNACTGCNACVVACQSENNVPIVGHEQVRRGREMHWLRVDRYFSGTPELPEVSFQPMPCMQCENAPCEQVCPVAATVRHRRRAQRHGLQPLHRHPLLLEQLPVQGAALQLLQLHQGHSGAAQARRQSRRHRALPRRDGEVHLLRAAHPGGERSTPRWRRGRWPTVTSRPPASRPVRRTPSFSATSAMPRRRSTSARRAAATTSCWPSSATSRAPATWRASAILTPTSSRRDDGIRALLALGGRTAGGGAGRRRPAGPCLEPAAAAPQSQHGRATSRGGAGGERLLLRRRGDPAAGGGDGSARRAARGRALLDRHG
jgi:MoCo/4Fe-4S cofactor protein with predicted Tat translocation signal